MGIVLYSNLIINVLVNSYDGTWEGSYFYAGNWELSLGRWFWVVMSKLFTFGVLPEPVISMITLAFFSAGIVLFLNILEIRSGVVSFLVTGMVLCTPAVSLQLSYRFMSYVFGVAFFLAILAAYVMIRMENTWIAIPMGALLVAFSMGAYQAFLGCTCVCILAWFIKRLLSGIEWKKDLCSLLKMMGSVILGGIFYVIILKLMLHYAGVKMGSYMGGAEYSPINTLKQLPISFYAVYQILEYALKGVLFYSNRLGESRVYPVVIGVLLVMMLLRVICKIGKEKKAILSGLLVILCVGLMPAAGCAIRFVATDANFSLQMATGLFLILPALYAVFCDLDGAEDAMVVKGMRGLCAILFLIVLYGAFWQVQIDQESMREGKLSVASITGLAIDELKEQELLSPEYEYCFIGQASASPLYCTHMPPEHTNAYAQYGAWWGGYNALKSWRGVVRDTLGLNLRFVQPSTYDGLTSMEEVKAMPVFPAEGSIRRIDNFVVVKFSPY